RGVPARLAERAERAERAEAWSVVDLVETQAGDAGDVAAVRVPAARSRTPDRRDGLHVRAGTGVGQGRVTGVAAVDRLGAVRLARFARGSVGPGLRRGSAIGDRR